jgi:hypothetical protein
MPLSRRALLHRMSAAAAGMALGARSTGKAQAGASIPSVLFDVTVYGARGDGASDDTAAFRAMHKAMRRAQLEDDRARATDPVRPPIHFLIRLPPRNFRYSWNRWTWGLRRFTLSGYGASIQCMHGGPYDVDQAPLIANREHYWTWPAEGPSYAAREDYGFLIAEARPGDTTVTVLPPASMKGFVPGAWVLIQSYAQQMDGYPPNMRYADRAQIVAIDKSTLHLDRPLTHLHKDNWPENPSQPACIGRARVVMIDRPDCPFSLQQEFAGLTVRSNPNHAEKDPAVKRTRETLSICGALQASVKDCSLIALGVTQAGSVVVERCSIGYTEPDKIVGDLSFADCSIGTLTECTGIDRLTLTACTLQSPARMFARDVSVERCTFRGEMEADDYASGIVIDGPNPTRRLSILQSRFVGRNDPTGLPLGGRIWAPIPIDGNIVRIAGAGVLVSGQSAEFGSLVSRLEEGWPLKVNGRAGHRFGLCEGIEGRPDGNLSLRLRLSGPLENGDTLFIPALKSLSVRNCKFQNSRVDYGDPPFLDWEDEVMASRILRLDLVSSFKSRPAWVPGRPKRIGCSVKRVYTGPDEGCWLTIQDSDPRQTLFSLAIDLKVAGQRSVDIGASRLMATDRLLVDGDPKARLPGQSFIDGANALIVPRPGAVPALPAGSDAEQALFSLEIEVENPFDRLKP